MSTPHYWFEPDGDDEPTMWRYPTTLTSAAGAVAVMRRCDNPEVFDFLKGLLTTTGTTHGDPYRNRGA